MEIVRIFVSDDSENGLWAIHLDGELQNEVNKFFDIMNDVEWLKDFFSKNESDLKSGFWGRITVGEAVLRTLDEVEEMEDTLYDYTEQGITGGDSNLQYLFKPLNNFEYTIANHQKSKGRIRRGWLRLYAIRLAENCFVVTGGAIKLTQDMGRAHLQVELKKLEQARVFLRDNGIDYPEDFDTYYNE